MTERVCFIGHDQPESAELQRLCPWPSIAHEMLPGIRLQDGRLWVEDPQRVRFLPVSRVVFHGIFEHDLDFLAALVLWGGPCFPAPLPMLDCRLRLSCLARALRYTRFGAPQREYAGPEVEFTAGAECVAKWGNWHCGENKERFVGAHKSADARLIEPYWTGEAVRVIMLGDYARQIRMTGRDWLKSVHGDGAAFMEIDPELLADTKQVKEGFGLGIIANDYIVTASGSKHLLEVNHIPSVTCLPELWTAYRDLVLCWLRTSTPA